MNNKLIRNIAISIITFSILVIGFCSGVVIGTVAGRSPAGEPVLSQIEFLDANAEIDADVNSDDEPSEELDLNVFWEAYQILENYYVDQPLDKSKLLEGAIQGMVDSLGDPHTRYSDAESYQEEQEYIEGGEYEGIGAWVDLSGDYVQITSPMRGSPAEAVGLKTKDLVIAIDGEDQTGVDPNLSLAKIKGPAGTDVVLTIKRGDEEPFDVTITRERLTTPMVTWEMRENQIAYIAMSQFGELTVDELEDAIDDLMPQNPAGIVLDLRNNGGGYVDTCISAAEEFLPKDSVVLVEKSGNGLMTEKRTRFEGMAQNIPLVVLGNEGTASASEILIGALQYHDRAIFVGTQTYGKGTMQIQQELSNHGAVSVTIARWLTPALASIHKVGITPDIVVEYTDEDAEAEIDPQYDKAVELLLEGVRPEDVAPIPEAEDGVETDL